MSSRAPARPRLRLHHRWVLCVGLRRVVRVGTPAVTSRQARRLSPSAGAYSGRMPGMHHHIDAIRRRLHPRYQVYLRAQVQVACGPLPLEGGGAHDHRQGDVANALKQP